MKTPTSTVWTGGEPRCPSLFHSSGLVASYPTPFIACNTNPSLQDNPYIYSVNLD